MFTPRRPLRMGTAPLALFGALALGSFTAGFVPAAETKRTGAEGYRQQELDDPLEKLVPIRTRTAADQARVEAAAWFMTGQLREGRNDFTGALDAYRKAVELDPNAVEVYRALVPLAFSLNLTKEAVRYATKAIELDPEDTTLLRRLGVHMASDRKIPEAIQLFEKAAESSRVDKRSAVYVSLKRDLAILHAAAGNMDKSADAFEVVFDALSNPRQYDIDDRTRAVLMADPATTFERIGQVFLEAKRYDKAVLALERAAKAQKGKPGAISFLLARVYQQTKRPEKALEELQKYFDAQLQSRGKAAYQLLVDVLKDLGKEGEAISRLEALAEKDARNSALQYFLAEQYFAAGRLEDAEGLYKKTVERNKDAEGYLGLASIYRKTNKPDELILALGRALGNGRNADELEQTLEALSTEIKAIGSDEKLVETLISAGRKLAEGDSPKLEFASSLILAKIASEAKKTEAVVQFYRYALKARRDRASLVYEELGQYLLSNDEYAEAAKVYQEAINENVGNKPNILFRLSQAEAFNNKTEAALKAVEDALKLVPDHPLLHYQKAWVHYHAKNYDEAIKLFEGVVEKFPENREIVRRCQFSLSNIYVQRGDQKKGEEVLEKILEQEPDDPSVNNDLGYLYADQGKNLEQAEKMIRKAIAAEPENAAYLDSMGWVLFKLGKFEEALPYLEKAVKLPTGSDTTLLDHLGDCYDRLKQPEKAREAWEKSLDHAKKESPPDQKVIDRVTEKLKNLKDGAGALKPQKPGSP